MTQIGAALCYVFFATTLLNTTTAADWPTHQADYRRSGVAKTDVKLPLQEKWTLRSPMPPATAWTGPAKWDAYSGNDGLQSLRNFDPAFYVTIGNGHVYYGSSLDDAAHAINATTGKESWVHFADAPVRLPPTLADDKAWFGSDDGSAYCVHAKTGERLWRFLPDHNGPEIVNNGRYISTFPVRTGVVVNDGTAYFAASLLPWQDTFLCAVDANSGKRTQPHHYVKKHESLTLQGAPLLAGDSILVPQGRSPMSKFRLSDGESLGQVADAGGVHCLLTDDDKVISGPKTQKNTANVLQLSEASSGKLLLTLNGVYRAAVADQILYFQKGKQLQSLDYGQYVEVQAEKAKLKIGGASLSSLAAIKQVLTKVKDVSKEQLQDLAKREAACDKWKVAHPVSANLIVTPSLIITGSKDRVQAFDRESGEEQWSAKVEGTAYGLAVGEGLLVVSTNHGHIYAFGGGQP